MIKDTYGRAIEILRISLTQDCNLKCPYCHREGESHPHAIMSVSEIKQIVSAFALLGIKKIKLTGGEPLLRKDITDIISTISKTGNISEISMTTNGTMLKDKSAALKAAGLNRLNIGCDSLSSSVLEKTVGRMKQNIISAKDAGFESLKLNMVVLKGINEKDIDGMIRFSKDTGVTLQLIELLKTEHNNKFYKDHFYSLEELENNLKKHSVQIESRPMHNRKRYHMDGATIEIVRPHSSGFCENCKTLRITSDGKIKPCLMRDDNLVDILTGIRSKISDNQLKNLILEAISKREPYASYAKQKPQISVTT